MSGIAGEQVRCCGASVGRGLPRKSRSMSPALRRDRASAIAGTAFGLKNQSLCSSFGGTNRCRPAANAEHDKRPRTTMRLADPILTAVHDDRLTGDKGGIVAC
jgi:hypothetical protein